MRRPFVLILVLCLALGGAGLMSLQRTFEMPPARSIAFGAGGPIEHFPPAPPLLPDPEGDLEDFTAAGPAVDQILDIRIQRNQSLYEAMQAAGARHEDIIALVRQVRPFRDLRKVRDGERFSLEMTADGELVAFGFDLDLESWVRYQRGAGGVFEQALGSYPVERRLVGTGGTIASSLYESLKAGGAPLDLAAKMSDILGWDIDFSRDVRRGDTYRIVYEEIYKDGQLVRTGAILACDYASASRRLAAYRYTVPDGKTGYFDREGRSLQKQLMRAPLNYSRVSSNFSYNRRHPVLGRNMPHLGVDYAAPIGTPVWAAGDGTVVDMGHDKANGRYMRLRHTNREYETYYLHFSRFARGLKVGSRVRQGEVIGYVGATGYATGPHLDFRVKKSGRFVNPRTLKLPPAEPVPTAEMPGFLTLCLAFDAALRELNASVAQPVLVTALTQPPAPAWQVALQPAEAAPPLLEASN